METPDLSRARWRTSSHSGSNGDCVEVADSGARILVRDTKYREGSALAFQPDAWRRFVGQLKADQDSPHGVACQLSSGCP